MPAKPKSKSLVVYDVSATTGVRRKLDLERLSGRPMTVAGSDAAVPTIIDS